MAAKTRESGIVEKRAGATGPRLSVALLLAGLLQMMGTGTALAQARTLWGTGYAQTGTAPSTGFNFVLPGINATATTAVTSCNVASIIAWGSVGADGANVATPGFFAPAIPAGTRAENLLINRDSLIPGCESNAVPAFTMDISFSAPVDPNALRMHVINLDAGTIVIGGNLTPNRLAGNNIFDVGGQRLNDVPSLTRNGGCQANDGSNVFGSCGSVNFLSPAATITSLQVSALDFNNTAVGGDSMHMLFSLTQPSLLIRKRKFNSPNGANEAFDFAYPANVVTSDANGVTPATGESITVAADGAFVDGTLRYIANPGLDTTIAETVPAGYVVSGTCYDVANANTVIATIGANGAVTLPASAVDPGAQIQCDYTNAMPADLAIAKQNENPSGGTVIGNQTTTYTVTVSNNGPGTSTGAVIRDTPGAGLTCAAANPVTCTGPAGACPAGAATVADLTGTAGLTLGTLAVGASVSLQFDCVVQ